VLDLTTARKKAKAILGEAAQARDPIGAVRGAREVAKTTLGDHAGAAGSFDNRAVLTAPAYVQKLSANPSSPHQLLATRPGAETSQIGRQRSDAHA
jgi:hypothetical protein